MKKYSLFFILFFFAFSYARAQFEFMQFENATYNLKAASHSNSLKLNHIKSYALKKLSGRQYFKIDEYILNSETCIISSTNFSKNGRIRNSKIYKYLNDTLITNRITLNHHLDTLSSENRIYDNKNRLILRGYKISFLLFFHKTWGYTYRYNDIGKLSAYSSVDKNGKDYYRYEYDFYENGSRKETRYFNQKNKLKERWTFECDQKGELESKSVKQGNFCTKREFHNDGTFIEVFDYTNEKGKHTKAVTHYTSDSLLILYEVYNNKGKLENKWEHIYDKLGNETQISYYDSKKLKRKFVYAYNDKNLCVKMDFYRSNGKLYNSFAYDYSYSN